VNADYGYVIPTRGDNLKWLEQAIFSIRCFDKDCEIVVVLKNQNEEINDLSDRYRIKLIQESRPGVFSALNDGVRYLESQGFKFFAFLGDDDLVMPNSGRNLRAGIKTENIKAVYGQCWYADKDLMVLAKNKGYPALQRFMLVLPNLIPNPGALISIEAWSLIGGYEVSYNWAADLDFWIKLRKLGTIKFVDTPMSIFRWHESSLTAGQRQKSLEESSLIRSIHTPRSMKIVFKILEKASTWMSELMLEQKMKK
jgi:hypothetical protein